jgi:hypothetical protein
MREARDEACSNRVAHALHDDWDRSSGIPGCQRCAIASGSEKDIDRKID